MHFDSLALIAVLRGAVVRPDDLLRLAIDGHDLGCSLLNHDVAGGEDVYVVNSAPRHLPFNLAVGIEDRQFAIALQDQRMASDGDVRLGGQQKKGERECGDDRSTP